MKKYPHGLDEETLPEDLELQEEIITRLEPNVEEAYDNRQSFLFKGLGKCYYAVGCCRYALDEPPAKVKESLSKAFETLYTGFDFELPLQAYEFIKLLSLAVVTGNSETAKTLANTKRDRYTNKDVKVEEITFAVAGLISAFVRKDKAAVEKILAENKPDQIESNKIFRFDRMLYLPLLPLLEAVYKNDTAKFAAAMQNREKEFVSFYKRAEIKNDPDALIDMPGLAIIAIARKHGINFASNSVYRPSELI
jgi:hypothetical protein